MISIAHSLKQITVQVTDESRTAAASTVIPRQLPCLVIRRAVKEVLRNYNGLPRIERWINYGATYLDPRLLVLWFLVKSNGELQEAKRAGLDSQFEREVKKSLAGYGYPTSAVEQIHVGLESSENVDRAGGWYNYFK